MEENKNKQKYVGRDVALSALAEGDEGSYLPSGKLLRLRLVQAFIIRSVKRSR